MNEQTDDGIKEDHQPAKQNSRVSSAAQAKWLDNDNNEVEKVFGFNKNAELVNSRAAMIGFILMILTELLFRGEPVTKAIFGIN